jgi:hypothetical protein
MYIHIYIIYRKIDPNFTAGKPTVNKENHPYNFSYGDQGIPEEKEYRELDNGFIAGKASISQQKHPYNFSYGKIVFMHLHICGYVNIEYRYVRIGNRYLYI